MGLTKVSQATAGRILWIDPSKYPIKYPNNHVRQWAIVVCEWPHMEHAAA